LYAEKLSRIDVFLLTHNRLLREAFARVLGKYNIQVVAAVAPDDTLIPRIGELKPKILALDSNAFTELGPDVIPAVMQAVPELRIISFGMDNDEHTFLKCVRAGISGYLLKEASATEVACALRIVAESGAVCPPNLCHFLFRQVASDTRTIYRRGRSLGLTRREQQLAKMIGLNLSNKEIAQQLNISEQTVKNHVHRMLRKLGVPDRLSVAEMCRDEAIVA